jgi:hypothetical protein
VNFGDLDANEIIISPSYVGSLGVGGVSTCGRQSYPLARSQRIGTSRNNSSPGFSDRGENIETEFRTASGVTDGRDRFIAGVVMITAGYSAEGKYSHFFITQAPLTIGNTLLPPGEYVFGTQRSSNDSIRVSFYRAANGEKITDVEARINRKSGGVRSLLIMPPVAGKALIQIGRFTFEYRVA